MPFLRRRTSLEPFGAWLMRQTAGPAAVITAAVSDDIAPGSAPDDVLGILIARCPVTATAVRHAPIAEFFACVADA